MKKIAILLVVSLFALTLFSGCSKIGPVDDIKVSVTTTIDITKISDRFEASAPDDTVLTINDAPISKKEYSCNERFYENSPTDEKNKLIIESFAMYAEGKERGFTVPEDELSTINRIYTKESMQANKEGLYTMLDLEDPETIKLVLQSAIENNIICQTMDLIFAEIKNNTVSVDDKNVKRAVNDFHHTIEVLKKSTGGPDDKKVQKLAEYSQAYEDALQTYYNYLIEKHQVKIAE